MEEKWIRFILTFYSKQTRRAFSEILSFYKNFVSYEDFTRYLIYKIEEKTELPPKAKSFIKQVIEDIYYSAPKEVGLPEIGESLELEDIKAIQMAESMSDFYLGRFFRGDRKLRKEVLSWLSDYYFKEGNPLGKGTRGIQEFLERFGGFLQIKTEHKARQIIETTAQLIKSASWINTMMKYQVKRYRWDAIGDRLTCKACRSMDGRIFKVEEGYREITELTKNPLNLTKIRPVLSKPFFGSTQKAPIKTPPAHPQCRCRIAIHTEEKEILSVERPPQADETSAQRELEERLGNLTPQERAYKLRIMKQDAEWARPPAKPKDRNLRNFLGDYVRKHFLKHKEELGVRSIKEYRELTREVLQNPERVLISLHQYPGRELTYWAFFKEGVMVIVSEDNYSILSTYKKEPEAWIREEKERVKNVGFVELR